MIEGNENVGLWALLAAVVTGAVTLGTSYFKDVIGRKSATEVSVLQKTNDTLSSQLKKTEAENEKYKQDIIHLTKKIQEYAEIKAEYESNTASIMIGVNLVLGHTIDIINDDQQKKLLKDLRQTITSLIGNDDNKSNT